MKQNLKIKERLLAMHIPKIWILFLINILWLPVGLFAASNPNETELWKKGSDFYQQNNFDSAEWYFSKLEAMGNNSGGLYFNLGNTYYKMGDWAKAILYFERAKLKTPGRTEVKDNLKLAQEKVVLPIAPTEPIFFIRWWRSLIQNVGPSVWAILMFLSFLGLLWVVYKRISNKEAVGFVGRWMALAGVAVVLFGLLFYTGTRIRTFSNKAVVMQNDAPFFQDKEMRNDIGALPAGATIRIKEDLKDKFKVILPNSGTAWINAQMVEKVMP